MAIQFFFNEPVYSLRDRNKLKQFLQSMLKREGYQLQSLNFIFCSDEYLLDINRQYLSHDYYTDIITFDLGQPNQRAIEGEIYISIDRVKDNALVQKETQTRELHRVIFHGVLHLCGYKDKKPVEVITMRAKEDYYLQLYFKVPRGTKK